MAIRSMPRVSPASSYSTSGELLVDKSVTINGAGADVLAVDGNATSRVFQIRSGETVDHFWPDDQEWPRRQLSAAASTTRAAQR